MEAQEQQEAPWVINALLSAVRGAALFCRRYQMRPAMCPT